MQACATEFGLVLAEIRHALRRLRAWMSPRRRRTPWLVAPARGWVQPEPFGVALILGPWNYPVQLLLTPLVSAIAAGNCALLKPSELAPRTAETIATLVRENFAEEFISVVPAARRRPRRCCASGSTKSFLPAAPAWAAP